MICLTHTSALEVYRSYGRLLPTVLDLPRTSKLEGCSLPVARMLQDEMDRLGAAHPPYHLLFPGATRACAREDVCRHVLTGTLPRRALIKIAPDVLIVGPELLFAQLASTGDIDEIDLALIGLELCGTYVVDEDDTSWDGLISTGVSLTGVEKIGRMLGGLEGRRGIKRARAALGSVLDASNSPMETVLAALFCFPRRLGGLGMGPAEMNRKVPTAAGDRWVDLFLLESGVGLEYKGKRVHSIERAGRDDRRQNKLVGSGVKILNVWYEDLRDPHLFNQLVQDVANAMGVRLRIRGEAFARRQALLRLRLMPSVERYGELVL